MTAATLQWAKRLTGVSVLLLLIGVVSYYNAMPSMYEQLDPAQNNMLELQPGESGQVEIAILGEYVALRMEDDDSANLRLIDSAGKKMRVRPLQHWISRGLERMGHHMSP